MFARLLSISIGLLAISHTSAQVVQPSHRWLEQVTGIQVSTTQPAGEPVLRIIKHEHEKVQIGQSVVKTPLTIGGRKFERGIGTHAPSHIQLVSPDPIMRFDGFVGVDQNERTQGGKGSVVFRVATPKHELHRSKIMREGDLPQRVDYDLYGAKVIDLYVDDGGDGPDSDHADWANVAITTRKARIALDDMAIESQTNVRARFPFSFLYGGKTSDELLGAWKNETKSEKITDGRTKTTQHWTDTNGVRITLETIDFEDYPAREWMLYFENQGKSDTQIFENVYALDVTFRSPLGGGALYRLHKTKGGPPTHDQFEPSVVVADQEHPQILDAGSGRSSSKDFPFFKVETGRGSAIVAVGWSGMWETHLSSPDNQQLHVTAGLQGTHFMLHPGEKVRSPRILMLCWAGDTYESNAQFRQLIYKYYAAKRGAKSLLPTLFCNTAFTRGGAWLNEGNAKNQISLINAYAPLGLEALLTDAGWFEGGWPNGAGNWTPRKDAYPEGMAPVAAAAKDKGMIYGLWFEPERVVKGTDLHKNHPDWLLGIDRKDSSTYLLNFGLPEARDYFFNIVKGFMDLPGFQFYRQDFNMDPLPYWRLADAPNRKGITEMKYIEGLYAYWDRIIEAWPDSFREECASGGNRIDLETVMRMHAHQKSDYWFDNEVDQASLWGLSEYLPNNTVVAHLNRVDDYSFHSTLASSLCLGWIADANEFEFLRAKKLTERYRQVRHLLTGAWYPLLPYSRDLHEWTGSQFHRADLDEGMILIFRRAESPYRTVDVNLRGLKPDATYELVFDSTGQKITAKGEALMKDLQLTLPEKARSDLIVYHKALSAETKTTN